MIRRITVTSEYLLAFVIPSSKITFCAYREFRDLKVQSIHLGRFLPYITLFTDQQDRKGNLVKLIVLSNALKMYSF